MTTITYIGILATVIILIAIVVYLTRQPIGKRDSSVEYTAALNYLILGDRQKALEKLRETVRYNTGNIDAYIKIGDLLREEGLVDRAIKIHRGLTVRRNLTMGQNIQILRSLIKDYEEIDKYDKAINACTQLLDLTHYELWAMETLLKLYEESGDWEKAFDTQKKIQKSRGVKDEKLLALYKVEAGLKLVEEEKEHDARLKFREAIKLDKKSPSAYLNLSDSYIREKRNEDALNELKRFISASPNYAHLAFERIKRILFEIGNYGEIETILQSLLSEHPDNESIRFALADILDRKGELERAIVLSREALERKPESRHARSYLAKFLNRKGDTKEALKYAIPLLDEILDLNKYVTTCQVCNFESQEPRWRCPNCHKWNTFNV